MEDKTVEKIAERSYEKGFKDGVKEYKERLEKEIKKIIYDCEKCESNCKDCVTEEILKLIQGGEMKGGNTCHRCGQPVEDNDYDICYSCQRELKEIEEQEEDK